MRRPMRRSRTSGASTRISTPRSAGIGSSAAPRASSIRRWAHKPPGMPTRSSTAACAPRAFQKRADHRYGRAAANSPNVGTPLDRKTQPAFHILVDRVDGSDFVLRRLRAIPYRPDGLSNRGAGAGALPQRYRRLGRSPERVVLPQGARVICELERGPLRLSWRSRPRRHAWGAELMAIRLATASAIIGLQSHRRGPPHQVGLPAPKARDRYRGRIGGPRPACHLPTALLPIRRQRWQTGHAGSLGGPSASRAPLRWRQDSCPADDGSGYRAVCRSLVYGVPTGRTKRVTSFNP